MNEYTASNGVTISESPVGRLTLSGEQIQLDRLREKLAGGDHSGISQAAATALREFFLHERDEQLGRWRSNEHPEYFVKPSDQFEDGSRGAWVRVVHDPTTFAEEFARHAMGGVTRADMRFVEVAREFFDAHPEPKPWDAAEEGDIWVLTGSGGMDLPWRRTADGTWESITPKAIRRRNEDCITAGRRIWPDPE